MHTLTVTPVSDNNIANEALTIDLRGSGLTTVNVPVSVTDDVQINGVIMKLVQ